MAQKTILVVDDEIHIVHVVAVKLRNNGYDVLTAENGADGLEIATREKPDMIVTDFCMPVMTGLEMVEHLRNEPETSDIPVIIITARGFAIEEASKRKLHISECLSKPFSPKELLRNIEDTLYQKALSK